MFKAGSRLSSRRPSLQPHDLTASRSSVDVGVRRGSVPDVLPGLSETETTLGSLDVAPLKPAPATAAPLPGDRRLNQRRGSVGKRIVSANQVSPEPPSARYEVVSARDRDADGEEVE